MKKKNKLVTLGLAVAMTVFIFNGVSATITDDSPLNIAQEFEINGLHYDFDGDGDADSNDMFLLNLAASVGRDQSGIDYSINAHKGASKLSVDQIKDRIAKAYREGRLDFDGDSTVTNFDAYAALVFKSGFTGDQLRPSNILQSFEGNGHKTAEFKPKYVADFRGDIRVTGTADVGALNVGILRSSRVAKLLAGAQSNGEISAPLITTATLNTDNARVGTINANVVDAGVIKSSGVAELGGVNVKGTVSATGLITAPTLLAENVDGNTIKAELMQVTSTANINNAILTHARANKLDAQTAGIETLGAAEARIKNLQTRDLSVDSRLNSEEIFTKNLFVGTHDPINVDNSTTALVAYEKVVDAVIEETPEIASLKARIKSAQKAADRYYGYAKRYNSPGYNKLAENYVQRGQVYKQRLAVLEAKQGYTTTKAARVGIGVNDPQQTLHISGAMRLEPLDSAPDAASTGDMYVNASGALCIYLNDTWNYITGEGTCSN